MYIYVIGYYNPSVTITKNDRIEDYGFRRNDVTLEDDIKELYCENKMCESIGAIKCKIFDDYDLVFLHYSCCVCYFYILFNVDFEEVWHFFTLTDFARRLLRLLFYESWLLGDLNSGLEPCKQTHYQPDYGDFSYLYLYP